MAHTTDRHRDLETESAQWAEAVKIAIKKINQTIFFLSKNNNNILLHFPFIKFLKEISL